MKKMIIIITSLFMTCFIAFAIYKGVPDTRKYKDAQIGEYELYYEQLYIFTFCEDMGRQFTLYENEEYQWDFQGVKTAIGCYSNLYIEYDNEYITMTEAVNLGLITEEEVLASDFGAELIRKEKLSIDASSVLKIESSIFDESTVVTDLDKITTIVNEMNNVGFLTGIQCEKCRYEIEMGYIKIYYTETEYEYILITRGGIVYNEQYSIYDGCELVDLLFELMGECPMLFND